MTDTIIVSRGDSHSDFALDFLKKNIDQAGRKNIKLIAADRGLEFFIKAGILPDTAVGDFDSLSQEGKDFLESKKNEMEIVRLKPEKDDSDTQSAMNLAIGRGAKDIAILGVTGRRVDHLIANFGLLILGQYEGAKISLIDQYNYVTLIPDGTVLKREEQFGRYVSFFSIGGDVDGLTLEGFKYPLRGYHLTAADSGLTVSNEIREKQARVTYTSGQLMMIMSRD